MEDHLKISLVKEFGFPTIIKTNVKTDIKKSYSDQGEQLGFERRCKVLDRPKLQKAYFSSGHQTYVGHSTGFGNEHDRFKYQKFGVKDIAIS